MSLDEYVAWLKSHQDDPDARMMLQRFKDKGGTKAFIMKAVRNEAGEIVRVIVV